jgi:hypothetical protein
LRVLVGDMRAGGVALTVIATPALFFLRLHFFPYGP